MSYSKCAMPSLSCLLSFYTIPISLFFEFEEFFYFLVYFTWGKPLENNAGSRNYVVYHVYLCDK